MRTVSTNWFFLFKAFRSCSVLKGLFLAPIQTQAFTRPMASYTIQLQSWRWIWWVFHSWQIFKELLIRVVKIIYFRLVTLCLVIGCKKGAKRSNVTKCWEDSQATSARLTLELDRNIDCQHWPMQPAAAELGLENEFTSQLKSVWMPSEILWPTRRFLEGTIKHSATD